MAPSNFCNVPAPAVEALAQPGGGGGRDGVVLKGYPLQLPVQEWLLPTSVIDGK